MTKKKLYGPTNRPQPRTPFFKEERAGDTSQQPLPQSLIPPEVQEHIKHNYPLPNSGGKAQTKSSKERKGRLAQRNATSSPRASRREKKPLTPDRSLSSPLSTHSTTTHSPPSTYAQSIVPFTHSTVDNASLGPPAGSYGHPLDLSHCARSSGPHLTAGDPLAQQPHFLASPPSLPRVGYLPYPCELPTNDPVGTYDGSNVSSLGTTTPSPRTGEMDSPSPSHVQSNVTDPWAQVYPSALTSVLPEWSDYPAAVVPFPAFGAYSEGSSHSRGEQFCMPEAYFPDTQLLYPGRRDPGPEYTPASSLVSAGSSPTNTALSAGTFGSDGMNVHAAATIASQPLGLNNGPVTDTHLPQFFPSSSSSLSAMINPRIDVYSHYGGGTSSGSMYYTPEGM